MEKYYKAKPMSRHEIRAFANKIRKMFEQDNSFEFPIVEVFEFLSNQGLFTFEILLKSEMGNKYGETFPQEEYINIREDIYEKACEGDPFGKSTMAHELFHFFYHNKEVVSLCRTDGEITNRKVYEDPEWQANCFASELLVPKHLIKNMSIEEVIKKCNVSITMADYQMRKYKEEDRSINN